VNFIVDTDYCKLVDSHLGHTINRSSCCLWSDHEL